MTVQEMVDEINSHGTTDEYGRNANEDFFYELEDLLDDNKEKEAVSLIQGRFKCETETANNVLVEFKKQIYDEFKKWESENIRLTPAQIAYNNAVAREMLNKPRCPICQSTNLKKISGWSKSMSTMVWGVFAAGRVSKTWHCNNCDSEW